MIVANRQNLRLEKDMYVRTTYGIGKILQGYIVYSDDQCFWQLAYTTDNPDIEVSVSMVENSWEILGEVTNDRNKKYEPLENNLDLVNRVYLEETEFICYVPVKNGVPRNASLYDDHTFLGMSYNPTDLLKIGDAVIVKSSNKNKAIFINKKSDIIKIKNDYKKEDIINVLARETLEKYGLEI